MIPKIKNAAKKMITFRMTFKDKLMGFHNAFFNKGAKEYQLVIYKRTNCHLVKDKKQNPIHDRNGNEVKVYSYWGYVKVGINSTEIVLGEDTVSDDTQSEDGEFQDLRGKTKRRKEPSIQILQLKDAKENLIGNINNSPHLY